MPLFGFQIVCSSPNSSLILNESLAMYFKEHSLGYCSQWGLDPISVPVQDKSLPWHMQNYMDQRTGVVQKREFLDQNISSQSNLSFK